MRFNFSGSALAIENEIQKELSNYLSALKGNASFDHLKSIRDRITMLEAELKVHRQGTTNTFPWPRHTVSQ
jgi:hypothetical protein